VAVEQSGYVCNIIAWIDHNSLAGMLVAENRAITMQHAHRQDLVNHIPIVYSGPDGILGI
jgi:hypothetical protein